MELLSKLLPTIAGPLEQTLFDTATRIPPISSTLSSITPESALRLHHLFNMTPETTAITLTTLSGRPEFWNIFNSTELKTEPTMNPIGKNFGEIPNKLKNENLTIEPLPVKELLSTISPPEMIISNVSITQSSIISTTVPSVPSVPTTVIIDGDSSVGQIDSFESDESEADEESISIPKTSIITKDDNLSSRLISTTTNIPSTPKIHAEEEAEKEESWNWPESFTKSTKEMEQVKLLQEI